MNEDRGSWYLLTAIVLGIGLGLLYSWVISPVEFVDTLPSSLREDYKDHYRAAIAAAYEANGDLQRANARLELLGDDDPALALAAQAQKDLAAGVRIEDAQAMAKLAAALGQAPTPLPTLPENTATPTSTSSPTASVTHTPTASRAPTETPTDTPSPQATAAATLEITAGPTLTPTITRTPSATPLPTRSPTATLPPTPTATLAPPFVLNNQTSVCNPLIGEAQIQVFVSNAAGLGIPGVEVVVIWNEGEEHFFTGLKPDIDPGYADFVMQPDTTYTLQVGEGGQLISKLISPACTNDEGEGYWGSWRLVFSHP